MNQGNIDKINNSWRNVISSFINNSCFVLLLDLPENGYALHGEIQFHKLVILPGDSFPKYFGGNSVGMGVEVYFRLGVWDCGKEFAALPDQSQTDKAARRNWVVTCMCVDQFDTSHIITSVSCKSSLPQRLSNLFVMLDIPKVSKNSISVTKSNPHAVMWRSFLTRDSQFQVTYEMEGIIHNIPKAVHLSSTFFITLGDQNVEAKITIANGLGFI